MKKNRNEAILSWKKHSLEMNELNNVINENEAPKISEINIAFSAWKNEILNNNYLISAAPNSNLKESWINRNKFLMKLFISRFEHFYLSQKITDLPPSWIIQDFKKFKKLFYSLN